MAKPEVLQSSYSRGSVRDLARHMLPKGATWKLIDYIPDLAGAPVQKRGGWSNAYAGLAGATFMEGVAWAPFSGGDQLVSIDNTGNLFSGSTSKGAAIVPTSRPVFFQNLLIVPGSTVKKYDGAAAPANLVGAPASALYAATYKSRLVLAVGNNLRFSDVLAPETYNSLSFVPFTNPIVGVAALRNMIAVFSKGRVERLRGSSPPPGGDMVKEPMFDEGCIDARSIVVYGDKVIWANSNGVHISDGAAIDNLISLGGLQQYWTTLMSAYSSSTWTLAAGLYQGKYVIAVMNGATFVDALMCDINRKTWSFLSNLPARMFAEAATSAPELYLGSRGSNAIGAFSGVFRPAAANAKDGNGVDVIPSIEYPYFRGAPGSKRWKNLHLGIDMAVDTVNVVNPKMRVYYTTQPESSSYTQLMLDDGVTPFEIPYTAGYERVKIPIHLASDGFGLKLLQVGTSAATMLFDLEAEVHERQRSA